VCGLQIPHAGEKNLLIGVSGKGFDFLSELGEEFEPPVQPNNPKTDFAATFLKVVRDKGRELTENGPKGPDKGGECT
jgi:hypothetical protein